MLLSTAITEICSRVNDPNQDTYGGRAEDLFHSGISALIGQGEWTVEDIPYLYRSTIINSEQTGVNDKNQLQIAGATNELDSGKNIIKIVDIVDGVLIANALAPVFKYMRITHEEFNRLSVDSEYNPQTDEIFWLIDMKGSSNQYIKFYTAGGTTMAAKDYKVSYIIAPLKSEFATSVELSERFSDAFTWKVIDFAEAKIKNEIAGA